MAVRLRKECAFLSSCTAISISSLRTFSEYDPERPFIAWALGVARYQVLNSRRRFARIFLLADSDLVDQLAAATYTEAAPGMDDSPAPVYLGEKTEPFGLERRSAMALSAASCFSRRRIRLGDSRKRRETS